MISVSTNKLPHVLSPNEKEDEDDRWQEEALTAQFPAEHEAGVTQNTEEENPQHVQLEELKEAIGTNHSGHHMFHIWPKSWKQKTELNQKLRSVIKLQNLHWCFPSAVLLKLKLVRKVSGKSSCFFAVMLPEPL